jgi:hypothetical protein
LAAVWAISVKPADGAVRKITRLMKSLLCALGVFTFVIVSQSLAAEAKKIVFAILRRVG